MIERETRSLGRLRLDDPEPGAIVTCAGCGHVCPSPPDGPIEGAAIRLAYQAKLPPALQSTELKGAGAFDGEHVTLDTALCADCLAEAIAILFGRRHVQRGGSVEDLADRSETP